MGYIFSFFLGGFLGVLAICCVIAAGPDNGDIFLDDPDYKKEKSDKDRKE